MPNVGLEVYAKAHGADIDRSDAATFDADQAGCARPAIQGTITAAAKPR